MGSRIAKGVAVVAIAVAAGAFRPEMAYAQDKQPLQLSSVEWAVADSAVVARGVITDIAADGNWMIVTLDVRETLKGTESPRLRLAAYRFAKGAAALASAKESRRELLWLLKRQNAAAGDAPERERVLARHHIDLHAPFLPGRPGEPTLPVVPLAAPQSKLDLPPPALLTIDFRLLKTCDELVKAIRSAIADTPEPSPIRAYAMTLPQEIAQRTGFSRAQDLNQLMMPVDRRLEEFARRLVQAPGRFAAKDDSDQRHLLRLEGVKALRLFPAEHNLAVVRAWLDDPSATEEYDEGRNPQSGNLVPPMPRNQRVPVKLTLPASLADVPEIHFQQPLTKAMKTEDAQLHTAVTIDCVELLNRQKTDGFIATLVRSRPDLAGLSFAMGDACRMKPEAGKQFVAALDVFHKAEASATNSNTHPLVTEHYQEQSAARKIDATASVAALMQVLGPQGGTTRGGLVKYLAGLVHSDATRALAKLAIFSDEAEVRTKALAALKTRESKDYTAILLAGLHYPWPAVAERSSHAIFELGRKELVPQLIAVLEQPDPRAPTAGSGDKQAAVVRELVRLNHHHSCLLCHAPAPREGSKDRAPPLQELTAQIPVPSESMVAYYHPSNPDILVRFDVTYLRQDFSTKLAVADADPWPDMQRYDFLVRTRAVSEEEARAIHNLLEASQANGLSPYHRAAHAALRALTGIDAQPTAAAWRQVTE